MGYKRERIRELEGQVTGLLRALVERAGQAPVFLEPLAPAPSEAHAHSAAAADLIRVRSTVLDVLDPEALHLVGATEAGTLQAVDLVELLRDVYTTLRRSVNEAATTVLGEPDDNVSPPTTSDRLRKLVQEALRWRVKAFNEANRGQNEHITMERLRQRVADGDMAHQFLDRLKVPRGPLLVERFEWLLLHDDLPKIIADAQAEAARENAAKGLGPPESLAENEVADLSETEIVAAIDRGVELHNAATGEAVPSLRAEAIEIRDEWIEGAT